MAIVVSLVLSVVSFVAGAQEQEIEIDEVFAERLDSCFFAWDCYAVDDVQKETILVNVFGILLSRSGTNCRATDDGIGWVTLGGRKGLEQLGRFSTRRLEHFWNFGDSESGYDNYRFSIRADGTGLYYDFSNIEEGESVEPSQRFACVYRTDETIDRLVKTPVF